MAREEKMTNSPRISRRQALTYGGLAAAFPLLPATRRGGARSASKEDPSRYLAAPATLTVRQSASATWLPPQPLQQWSTDGPALAAFNGRLYMAWMGSGGDLDLWWSSSDGYTWTPQQRMPNSMRSSDSPSLAAYNDRLYAAWRGTNSDYTLYWSDSNG
jgi:hypothetical protein